MQNKKIKHIQFGFGIVIADMGQTIVCRFDKGKIIECEKSDVKIISSIEDKIESSNWDLPLPVLNKVQAETIESINNTWGVFACSKIELLPHQLWVCKQVNSEYPTRWIVADDVGLGKTIEAGLILTPLIANNKIKRLLIITPASLVDQWRDRMNSMFDIRLTKFVSEISDEIFWKGENQVVASLQTLRIDDNRIQTIIDSGVWDMVFVDEAHHLNADQQKGFTLGYNVIKKLSDAETIKSMVFFTGTPHRGKNFGFLALLKLLKPDVFDPRKSLDSQAELLKDVMIRNNKYNVTDLYGNKLFKRPIVKSETYEYSEKEQKFYDTLSEFILTGQAYAGSLGTNQGSAVMLVLISMQKLASSSVAAIRKALKNRINKIGDFHDILQSQVNSASDEKYLKAEENLEGDKVAELEESLPEQMIKLMENEIDALKNLYSLALEIEKETKILKIMKTVETNFNGRSVLFFTEYKATQALMLSGLMKKYGKNSVLFINGDEKLSNVQMPDGEIVDIKVSRKDAAEKFNSGEIQFLIATEAAGEGIDLQEKCYSLIHIDLPWNPMRLHQRVGRLNRYGQKHQVEVTNFRNPSTVESRIWEILTNKLENVSQAFDNVMDESEDIQQLVLGMTTPKMFRDIYSQSQGIKPENLESWFDSKTATFGGDDAVEAVKAIVGNSAQFDFKQVSKSLPKVDLPDLQPFFELALHLNNRRPDKTENLLTFKTPDNWRTSIAVRRKYECMTFSRIKNSEKILGVGNKVVNTALETAKKYDDVITVIPEMYLPESIAVFRIQDRVTANNVKPSIIVGVAESNNLMFDWELLKILNKIPFNKEIFKSSSEVLEETGKKANNFIDKANKILREEISSLNLNYKVPDSELIALFCTQKKK